MVTEMIINDGGMSKTPWCILRAFLLNIGAGLIRLALPHANFSSRGSHCFSLYKSFGYQMELFTYPLLIYLWFTAELWELCPQLTSLYIGFLSTEVSIFNSLTI